MACIKVEIIMLGIFKITIKIPEIVLKFLFLINLLPFKNKKIIDANVDYLV